VTIGSAAAEWPGTKRGTGIRGEASKSSLTDRASVLLNGPGVLCTQKFWPGQGYLLVESNGWNQAGYVRGGVKLCKMERKFGITA
jgi:hypothetical protein